LHDRTIMPRPLRRPFFARDVHAVARDLIGATLLFKGVGGRIVEVEAYHHTDPAAHSYNGQTPRNAVMFGPPGFAYVYRSYGIHWCVNFVCEAEGSASPGRICAALGITGAHNGLALDTPPFALSPREAEVTITVGPRIGITKAADLPWRYGLKGSRFLSKPFRARATR
jgi:DNA-3-methyladenine glycosylase